MCGHGAGVRGPVRLCRVDWMQPLRLTRGCHGGSMCQACVAATEELLPLRSTRGGHDDHRFLQLLPGPLPLPGFVRGLWLPPNGG